MITFSGTNLFRYSGIIILSWFKNKFKILSMKIHYFKLLFLSQFLKESFVVQAWCSGSPIWLELSVWRVCKCGSLKRRCVKITPHWPASRLPVLFGDDNELMLIPNPCFVNIMHRDGWYWVYNQSAQVEYSLVCGGRIWKKSLKV